MYRRITKFTDVWNAQRLLLEHLNPIGDYEVVPVFQAFGRVVYEPVVSPADLPSHNASHMDGYAVNSSLLQNASPTNPVKLRTVGVCYAGKKPEFKVGAGETARILTGAYLPEGCDAVVPQESVTLEGEYVVFTSPATPYQYVDMKGFDVSAGQTLFERGRVLKMADVALAAALGFEKLKVVRRPRVGIVAVGDELTDDFSEAKRGKVLNTHSHVVARLVEAAGGEPLFLGIVPDSRAAFLQLLENQIQRLDILLSIAGSSVSEKDVSSILASENKLYVHGLTLQPGRVGGFTFYGDKPFIFLPGLIMSTLNVFMFLAYPVLRKMLHQEPRYYHHRVKAVLAEDITFRKYHDFVKVVWVRVVEDDEGLRCYPVLGESSGMSIPSRSDGFIIAPPGTSALKAGEKLWVNYPPTL
ncbi:MAG: molybdopterin molybdotransferase MoeA [Aigarchaeota archaeon]|nr:molybdopterin molybdotransferase MoeA [Candidatus Caldarchaeales archaeon]